MTILLNIIGIVVLLGALYFFSSNKKLINKKMILKALVLQFVLAFLLVKVPLGQVVIEKVSDVVTNILGYGSEGLAFVFGPLADAGAPTGMVFGIQVPLGQVVIEKVSDVVTNILGYGSEGLAFVFGPLADAGAPTGMVFGIQVLGNIIFISALVAALYYLGVIGAVVKVIGGVIGKILGTSKVESFVATANMFLGQTESPILVSKYLKNMSESEIMLVLVSGMGSMSATVLMGYSGMGIPMKYLLIGGALVPLGSILML